MVRTVMVVEDDDAIRLVLRTNLEDEGYRVIESVTAEQALLLMIDERADVVLVDLRLPGIQGLDLIRSLRGTSQVPIIIVTAQTDSHDVVAGLEAGADDYVTKPFVAKELMARIRTLLRRVSPTVDASAVPEGSGALVCGPIELDPDTAEVLRYGEPVPVSRIEFYVLAELIGARGKVLSRDHLLRTVWGYGNAGDGRVVDNLVYRLRSKIEDDPANPELLMTVRGFGYRMKA
ncbi:MAG: response regulator transcription factor [Actinobacteria bacterium]|nr:response regulator transcription factor [Actinomycetota bacterium]